MVNKVDRVARRAGWWKPYDDLPIFYKTDWYGLILKTMAIDHGNYDRLNNTFWFARRKIRKFFDDKSSTTITHGNDYEIMILRQMRNIVIYMYYFIEDQKEVERLRKKYTKYYLDNHPEVIQLRREIR